MAPLRSLGNIRSAFDDFYARTGKDAVGASPGGEFIASGGTKSTAGSRTYHEFKAPNTSPVSQNFVVTGGSGTITYLVVGGGGGGGGPYGGGGGAGAVKTRSVPLGPGTYAVVAGAGGAGSTGVPKGTDGTDSTFAIPGGTVTAGGGGAGGGGGGSAPNIPFRAGSAGS